MKKSIAIVGIISALCQFVSAQSNIEAVNGHISFDNYLVAGSVPDPLGIGGKPIYLNTVGTYAPSADTFVQFFVAPQGSSTYSPITLNGSSIFALSEDGYFSAGNMGTGRPDSVYGNGSLQPPTVSSFGSFKLQAWNGASTYDAASTKVELTWDQLIGTTGAGTTPPNALSLTMGSADYILLQAVPEPATITLGVLGGVALLARRRREQAV